MAQGTESLDRVASRSIAPGKGRILPTWRRYFSMWRRLMRSISSALKRRPISRVNALTTKPPLIPTRRWMRQYESSMPIFSSASFQATTCWYTLSMSVPSRSKRNAALLRSFEAGPGFSFLISTAPRAVHRVESTSRHDSTVGLPPRIQFKDGGALPNQDDVGQIDKEAMLNEARHSNELIGKLSRIGNPSKTAVEDVVAFIGEKGTPGPASAQPHRRAHPSDAPRQQRLGKTDHFHGEGKSAEGLDLLRGVRDDHNLP